MPRLTQIRWPMLLACFGVALGAAQEPLSLPTAASPAESRMLPVQEWPEAGMGTSLVPSRWDVASRGTGPLGPPTLDGRAPAVKVETFELAETMAQVGDQYILKGELLGDANLALAPMLAQLEKLPAEEQVQARGALLEQRAMLMEQLLTQAIERKLKYLEFLRQLPTESDPKKLEERRQKFHTQAERIFRETLDEMVVKLDSGRPEDHQEQARKSAQLYRIAVLMKDRGIRTHQDIRLDPTLRSLGTSLEKQQLAFWEYLAGNEAIRRSVNFQPEITHDQMVAYYREHPDEFLVPTRARWEQLSVYFSNYSGEEAVALAWNAICEMGNQVLSGQPFWDVAQRRSQEKNAARGGFHDWTRYGDLKVSRVINETVFTSPLQQMTPVIEDDRGLHIIRVLERQEQHTIPFGEAQTTIKEKLKTEALNKAYADYTAKLRDRTPVQTRFPTRDTAATNSSEAGRLR